MTRKLTDHKADDSERIIIEVVDDKGVGGAHHSYLVHLPDSFVAYRIDFQLGPVAVTGVNGMTQEVLIAIVVDRLRCFQAGPLPCTENEDALAHLTEALAILHKRTRDRRARSVEGTLVP